MADILPIVATRTVHDVKDILSDCEPDSYYALTAMAEFNGDKARSILDVVKDTNVRPDNVGEYLSKCSPHAYYIIKGFQELADA